MNWSWFGGVFVAVFGFTYLVLYPWLIGVRQLPHRIRRAIYRAHRRRESRRHRREDRRAARTQTETGKDLIRMTATHTGHLDADIAVFGTSGDGCLYVLLVRHTTDTGTGTWTLPGGHVTITDSVQDTARRALAEQTGLTVGDLIWVDTYTAPRRDPRNRYAAHAYTVLLPDMPEPTIEGAAWMDVDTACAKCTPIGHDHKQVIEDALRTVERQP